MFIHFVRVSIVQPYSSFDTGTARKEPRFILSEITDFYMIDSQSITVQAFPVPLLTSFYIKQDINANVSELVH